MTPKWYAVYTLPQKEPLADRSLRRQGFMTFYPFVRLRQRRRLPNSNRAILETVERPYFPRYLFVAIRSKRDSFFAINEAFGVSAVVSFCGEPVQVPDVVMDELMSVKEFSRAAPPEVAKDWRIAPGLEFRFPFDSPFVGLLARISRVDSLDKSGEVLAWVKMFGSEREISVPARTVSEALGG